MARPPFATTPRGPIDPPGSPVTVPPARWSAIVADLAARGAPGAPELISARAVTWHSGALGCPRPGVAYTQAMVEGMRVIVKVEGTTYDYRFGASDSPMLCTRRR